MKREHQAINSTKKFAVIDKFAKTIIGTCDNKAEFKKIVHNASDLPSLLIASLKQGASSLEPFAALDPKDNTILYYARAIYRPFDD